MTDTTLDAPARGNGRVPTDAHRAKTAATLKAKGRGSTEHKRCPCCGEMKRRIEDFGVANGMTASYCSPCATKKQREWHKQNPHVSRKSQFKITLRREHGMTVEQYADLLAVQGGGCAICGAPTATPTSEHRLTVDHDHENGLVRGLLCRPCNSALGHFRDSLDLLAAAVRYLQNPPCQTGLVSRPQAKSKGKS